MARRPPSPSRQAEGGCCKPCLLPGEGEGRGEGEYESEISHVKVSACGSLRRAFLQETSSPETLAYMHFAENDCFCHE